MPWGSLQGGGTTRNFETVVVQRVKRACRCLLRLLGGQALKLGSAAGGNMSLGVLQGLWSSDSFEKLRSALFKKVSLRGPFCISRNMMTSIMTYSLSRLYIRRSIIKAFKRIKKLLLEASRTKVQDNTSTRLLSNNSANVKF